MAETGINHSHAFPAYVLVIDILLLGSPAILGNMTLLATLPAFQLFLPVVRGAKPYKCCGLSYNLIHLSCIEELFIILVSTL